MFTGKELMVAVILKMLLPLWRKVKVAHHL